MNIITGTVFALIQTTLSAIGSFIPKFIAGILVLLIGLIVASIAKDILKLLLKYLSVEKWLASAGLAREKEVSVWTSLVTELVRWTVIFLFLTSTVDVWGVPKVGEVLNQLLLFLPNVFVAVVVGLVGIVLGKFAYDIVRHGVGGLGEKESVLLAHIAKYAILFFTALIILTQLGVAAELVKILFTGIVGSLALAFGLSFGLGGQNEAMLILKKLRLKIEESSHDKVEKSDKPRRK